MAKFRRNHERNRKTGFGGLLIKVLGFMVMLGVGFVYLYRVVNGDTFSSNQSIEINTDISGTRAYLPAGCQGELINHNYYSLCYIEKLEMASWVAYPLTAASLRKKNVPRSKNYIPDPMVSTKSAKHGDYTHSGYTRGHLAPAGDMAFNELAMKETFYMSNMTPQLRGFNNGIWKELEENVRDWAEKRGVIYVVSGPIMDGQYATIGYNKIAIPPKFYKILLDPSTKEAIAYVIPNEIRNEPLEDFAVSIDEVEQLTQINFFDTLLDDDDESSIESKVETRNWKTDRKKYKSRLEIWNKQR